MREIKFRFWDRKQLKFETNFVGIDNKGRILVYFISLTGGLTCSEAEELIPQQYTGLTDDYSQEVYEGDIIEYDYPLDSMNGEPGKFYRIEWKQAYAGEMFCAVDLKSGKLMNCYGGLPDCDFRVVGHIYENQKTSRI